MPLVNVTILARELWSRRNCGRSGMESQAWDPCSSHMIQLHHNLDLLRDCIHPKGFKMVVMRFSSKHRTLQFEMAHWNTPSHGYAKKVQYPKLGKIRKEDSARSSHLRSSWEYVTVTGGSTMMIAGMLPREATHSLNISTTLLRFRVESGKSRRGALASFAWAWGC